MTKTKVGTAAQHMTSNRKPSTAKAYIVTFIGRRIGSTGVHYPNQIQMVEPSKRDCLARVRRDFDARKVVIRENPVRHYTPAVETRYIDPTNNRGSRVKATHLCTRKSITVPWEDAFDAMTNHALVAEQLFEKGVRLAATGVNGGGYIFTELAR